MGKRVIYYPLPSAVPCHEGVGLCRERMPVICREAYRRNHGASCTRCPDMHDSYKALRSQPCDSPRAFPHWLELHGDLEAFVCVDSFHRSAQLMVAVIPAAVAGRVAPALPARSRPGLGLHTGHAWLAWRTFGVACGRRERAAVLCAQRPMLNDRCFGHPSEAPGSMHQWRLYIAFRSAADTARPACDEPLTTPPTPLSPATGACATAFCAATRASAA
jgi:hypothetical protein